MNESRQIGLSNTKIGHWRQKQTKWTMWTVVDGCGLKLDETLTDGYELLYCTQIGSCTP